MKIHYDPKADAMYIPLANGKYEVSRIISDSVIVDEDKKGNILGVEVLDVSVVFGPKFRSNMRKAPQNSAVAHKISK